MLKHLKAEAGMARTENGAVTFATTHSACLDLFASIGGLRSAREQAIISRFRPAFAEDPDIAMKTLFFARDVRGGLGERRVFRVILKWLADFHPASVRKNLPHIAEFGRWDDVLALLDTCCAEDALRLIRDQLIADRMEMDMGGNVSLLAKWLPSVNASNAAAVQRAKRIARYLGMDDRTYRKTLVALRARLRIIENDLREKNYTFDYSKQPSRALYKYRAAFLRNDADRYGAFLNQAALGEVRLNTAALTPYDVIAPCFTGPVDEDARNAMDVTWNALEDFTGGENALVVVDGSGSMYGGARPLPAAVALSLGIYFAERNTGVFKNHFITFSTRPRLVEIKGQDICGKVNHCRKYNEVANTSIQRVFELILRTAVKHHVPQADMPSTLYIISDMEFDCCTADASLTNFQYAQRIFRQAGYRLPRVVFWNVASRTRQQPVTMSEQGVALVSGCNPSVFGLLSAGNLSPMGYMLDILGAERYAKIAA